ncbi:hypothetical protein PC116_g15205 [Phytophthora cactorum]|nr:hypothetical protein PC116_g15205 [Phytophthora cactorum]
MTGGWAVATPGKVGTTLLKIGRLAEVGTTLLKIGGPAVEPVDMKL